MIIKLCYASYSPILFGVLGVPGSLLRPGVIMACFLNKKKTNVKKKW